MQDPLGIMSMDLDDVFAFIFKDVGDDERKEILALCATEISVLANNQTNEKMKDVLSEIGLRMILKSIAE